jgi:hypothetical protein
MESGQKSAHVSAWLRELSDKELNKITNAVGEQVRTQTIEQ